MLLIQGKADPIVPEHHGRILYDAAAEPKQYWKLNLGHVKSWTYAATKKRLLEYLERLQ